MAQSSSHEMYSVSCAPPRFGCFSRNIEVEDDKSSMEEPEVKDDKSSIEEPEVKLGGGGLSERDESGAEAECS
jgi:hypothetical protein